MPIFGVSLTGSHPQAVIRKHSLDFRVRSVRGLSQVPCSPSKLIERTWVGCAVSAARSRCHYRSV